MTTHELANQLLLKPDVPLLTRDGCTKLDERSQFIPFDCYLRVTTMRKVDNKTSEVWRELDGICETFKAVIL